MPNTATQTFDFVVSAPPPPPLSVVSAPPSSATQGIPYSHTFVATGGLPPYSWTLSAPIPGLTLDATSGILSGTPTTTGTTPGDVATVTDSAT